MISIFGKFREILFAPWSVFFLPHFFVLILWWLAFYPGVMTSDSMAQWEESANMSMHDWHPYLHTLLIAGLRLIWNSPAVISLLQALLTSALFATIFSYLWRNGVNRYVLGVFYFLVLTSLPIGIYTVTLWKDIPFSLSVIAMGFFLMVKMRERTNWKLRECFYLMVLLIASIFFRHNGLIFVLVIPILLWIYFYKERFVRWFTILLIPTFLFFYICLPTFLDVVPTPYWLGNFFIYHSTAAFYARMPYTSLTPASKAMMEAVLPGKEFVTKYQPVYLDALYWNPLIDNDLFKSKVFWQVIVGDFYKSNLWNNLPTFVGERANLFVATITTAYNGAQPNGVEIMANDFGLKSSSLLNGFHTFFLKILTIEQNNVILRLLTWYAWLGVILGPIFLVASFFRRKYHFQIFTLVVLIQLPFLFVLSPAGDWRYVYFLYLATLVMVPIYLLPTTKNKID